jgi:hypothetical protein
MEMCGRIAVVAHEPVFSVVRTCLGFRLGLFVLIASNLLNLITCAAELGGLAIVLHLLTGWPEKFLILNLRIDARNNGPIASVSVDRAGVRPIRAAHDRFCRLRSDIASRLEAVGIGSSSPLCLFQPQRWSTLRLFRCRNIQCHAGRASPIHPLGDSKFQAERRLGQSFSQNVLVYAPVRTASGEFVVDYDRGHAAYAMLSGPLSNLLMPQIL